MQALSALAIAAVGCLLLPASDAFRGAVAPLGLHHASPPLRAALAIPVAARRTERAARWRVPAGTRQLRASASGGGEGELIFSATSTLNGEVQVYELPQGAEDGVVVRALWFSASPAVWQSAVQMRRVGDDVEPDWSVLPFSSSRAHAFASALVEQPPEGQDDTAGAFAKSVMVLGLGGGTLAGWLLALPGLSALTCSELDPHVREAASTYFGLKDDPRLTLQLGDGLEHAAQAKEEGKMFDLVAVDIGSSQSGDAKQMLAPPPSVRTKEALQTLCDVVAPGGVLSMTIVGGSDEEMLALLQNLEDALGESGGGSVRYFENRAAEKWLQSNSASIPARMAFALKSTAPPLLSSESAGPVRGSRDFMRARAQSFDSLYPPSPSAASVGGLGGMGPMVQRVQVELNDISGLSTRIKQQSVFNAMKPSAATLQKPASGGGGGGGGGLNPAAPDESDRAGSKAGAGARAGKAQAGWDKERERAAQTRNDAAYQAQACCSIVKEC